MAPRNKEQLNSWPQGAASLPTVIENESQGIVRRVFTAGGCNWGICPASRSVRTTCHVFQAFPGADRTHLQRRGGHGSAVRPR